jgi:hypothetical protein
VWRPSPDLVPVGIWDALPFPFESGVTVPCDTDSGFAERIWGGREDIGFELYCGCGGFPGSTLIFGTALATGGLVEVFVTDKGPVLVVEVMLVLDSSNSGWWWSSFLLNFGC